MLIGWLKPGDRIFFEGSMRKSTTSERFEVRPFYVRKTVARGENGEDVNFIRTRKPKEKDKPKKQYIIPDSEIPF
jgi:hypothetical protein